MYLIMLSVKQGSMKYHFWVFGMTRPGIEPLANTQTIMPTSSVNVNIFFQKMPTSHQASDSGASFFSFKFGVIFSLKSYICEG